MEGEEGCDLLDLSNEVLFAILSQISAVRSFLNLSATVTVLSLSPQLSAREVNHRIMQCTTPGFIKARLEGAIYPDRAIRYSTLFGLDRIVPPFWKL